MVFSSLVFLLFFLPALLLVYYLVPARFRGLRNLILLGASLFFYWWGPGPLVLLMVLSISVNYVGGLLAGMSVTCVCPRDYRPAADVVMFAHKYGSAFHLTADPAEGIQDADVVATAVWNTAKPGTPESEQRLRDFVGFQLTGKLLESAKPDVMVLHCLPAHRGEEISSAVFEQHAPEIFDEAENRLHVQKAVLAILLAGK